MLKRKIGLLEKGVMYNEEEIIKRIRNKDISGLKWLFNTYYKSLCLFAFKYIDSYSDAEDIVQDIYVSFWNNKKGKEIEGSIRAYLFGAVYKAAMQKVKQSGRFVFQELENIHYPLPESFTEEEDDESIRRRNKIKEEIEKLPEKSKEVFHCIVLENLSYKETAIKLCISVNTVKTHYGRALKQLRKNLDVIIYLLWLKTYKNK